MQLSSNLKHLYDNYYSDGKIDLQTKRDLTAIQSVRNFKNLFPGKRFNKLLDIGAGDGNTLSILSQENLSDELSAIEISISGINKIKGKAIKNLVKVELFDGYKIMEESSTFDIGIALHVLEHVEHERVFISEIARVCKYIYIEVPLEGTFFIEKAILVSSKYGHINFYQASTLKALMESCNLKVLRFNVFSHSKEYEILLNGYLSGTLRYFIKKLFLNLFPRLATFFFTYTCGIVVTNNQKIDN
jgi:ubiquinone/menaquinone biosynthesis C-methylase UbiE